MRSRCLVLWPLCPSLPPAAAFWRRVSIWKIHHGFIGHWTHLLSDTWLLALADLLNLLRYGKGYFFLLPQTHLSPKKQPEKPKSPSIEASSFNTTLISAFLYSPYRVFFFLNHWKGTPLAPTIRLCIIVLILPSNPIIARAQASLVSELSRFEAELDSEIQGLERRLSQKKQRRGRGEVLSPPPDYLCWSSPSSTPSLAESHPHPYSPHSQWKLCVSVRPLCLLALTTYVFFPTVTWITALKSPACLALRSICYVNHLPASSPQPPPQL